MKYKKDFHKMQKDYISQYPNSNIMRSLVPKKIKNKRILDIGCGSGIDLEYFMKQDAIIYGIDNSPELIQIAKNNLSKNTLLLGDFSYLPWKSNYFDIVWSKYALQHSKDIRIQLNELFRVLIVKSKVYLQVTHPMRSTGMLSSKNYFEKNTIINYPTIDKKIINEYHHTLSDWINNILNIGFKIIKVEEILNKPVNEYKGTISPSAIIFILEK